MTSSGDWEGESKHLYFNDKHKKLIEEKKRHLKKNYDGIGDFFLQKLREEEVLTPEERLQELQNQEQQIQEEKEELKNEIRQQQKEQKLSELEDRLRSKQERLREVEENDLKSVDEFKEEIIESAISRGHHDSRSDISDDWMEKYEMRAKNKFENQPDVQELRAEIDSLQRKVAELNGGREDWFLDLKSVEVSA